MGVVTPNQFKRGLKIEVDKEPYSILEYLHIKTGRGGATVRTKMRSLTTGNVLEKSFRSEEKITTPDFEEKKMQYLYSDDEKLYLMDNETFEQIEVQKQDAEQQLGYLLENLVVSVHVYNGKVIGLELPNFVEIEIAETDPGVRGDTVTGGSKSARLVTGASVSVPLFINIGDVIKVDTREGTYIERVQTAKD